MLHLTYAVADRDSAAATNASRTKTTSPTISTPATPANGSTSPRLEKHPIHTHCTGMNATHTTTANISPHHPPDKSQTLRSPQAPIPIMNTIDTLFNCTDPNT